MVLNPTTGESEGTGAWVALSGANLTSLYEQQIGVRLQASPAADNEQRLLLLLHGVPDGSPSQDLLRGITCFSVRGAVGSIVPSAEYASFEGAGAYALSATLSFGPDASTTSCRNGPPSESAFTWTPTPATAAFFGHPQIAKGGIGQGGLVVTVPLGEDVSSEAVCARNPIRAADGSLTGATVSREVGAQRIAIADLVKRPGRWGCVARATIGAIKLPWSAPVMTVVRTTFDASGGQTVLRDASGPTYRITRQFDRLTAGASYTLTLTRQARRDLGVRATKIALRGRLDRRGRLDQSFRLPPPPRSGVFIGYVATLQVAATALTAAAPTFAFIDVSLRTNGGRTVMRLGAP
jgi:hypothetical protein